MTSSQRWTALYVLTSLGIFPVLMPLGWSGDQDSAESGKDGKPTAVELLPLNTLIGKWTGRSKREQPGRTPDVVLSEIQIEAEWTLGGHFLKVHSKSKSSDDSVEYTQLFTYDKNEKAYLLWYFDSQGSHVFFRGSWDSRTSTFEFKSRDLPDSADLTLSLSPGQNATNAMSVGKFDGKVLFRSTSKLERVK